MAVEALVLNGYSTIVSWTYVLLTILLVVKIIQFFTGGSLFGDKTGGGGGGGGNGEGGDSEKKKKKSEEERKKFEEGIANPAFIQIWATNRDDKNVPGVELHIFAKKFKGDHEFGPFVTGPDGLYPTDDYINIPSGVPVTIKYNYWLKRAEKYKSEKRSLVLAGLTKKRRFWDRITITLGPGEKKRVEIKLPFKSEYPIGFEPFIKKVDTTSDPGRIRVKGIIRSMSGK